MQVGNQFAVMGADCGLWKDMHQAVAPGGIDLVEKQRRLLCACPESEGAIAHGRFEHRVIRSWGGGFRHQPGQHWRARELLQLDLRLAANMPGRQSCFDPVEARFRFPDAGRQIDPRSLTQPKQSTELDGIVIVVDAPGVPPVPTPRLFCEHRRHVSA